MANKKQEEESTPILGILSMVCAIVSWLVLGIVLAPISIIIGIVGACVEKEKTPSIIGIIVGAIGLIVLIFAFGALSSYNIRF